MKHARIQAIVAAALMSVILTDGALAQGLDAEGAIDAIVGSEIKEQEARMADDMNKVMAAIDKTEENITTIRKVTKLDRVEIVFLADAAVEEGGPPPEIVRKIEEHEDEIATMRQELEGNALLYHAIDSRQVLLKDVLALEFDDANGVTIYAAAKPAG